MEPWQLPLAVEQPQTYGQMMQGVYQNRLLQQTGQENDQKLQQMQQAQAGDQAQRQAINDHLIVDPNSGQLTLNRPATFGALIKSGYGDRAMSLQGQLAQGDQAAAEAGEKLRQSQLASQKAQLDTAKAQVDLTGQLANGITDQTSYDRALQHGYAAGILKPGELPAVYDPQVVRGLQQQALTAQQHIAAVQQQLGLDETARHNQAEEQQSAATLAETQQRDAATAANQRGELAVSRGRLGIEGARLRMDQQAAGADTSVLPAGSGSLTGQAFLDNLKNPALAQLIKTTANGDTAAPSPNSRADGAQALRQAVLQYDPTWTDARYKGKQDFKTGKDAQTITQFATALSHLQDGLEGSGKIGLSPALGGIFQTPADAAYVKSMQLFTQEAGKAIKNGVLTEGEYKDLMKGSDSMRQDVRDASLNKLADLFGGKVQAMFQKYKTATGQDLPVNEFFDKPTQGRLQKLGVVPTPQVTMRAPNGQTQTVAAGDVDHYTSLGAKVVQ